MVIWSPLVTETDNGWLKTHSNVDLLATDFLLFIFIKSIIKILFVQMKINPVKWKCCHHLPEWQKINKLKIKKDWIF